MRELKELIELLDRTNEEEYQDLMRRKRVYLSKPDMDSFIDLQSLALAIYSDAKFAFSCGQITLEELHSVQEHILSGLWRYPE